MISLKDFAAAISVQMVDFCVGGFTYALGPEDLWCPHMVDS